MLVLVVVVLVFYFIVVLFLPHSGDNYDGVGLELHGGQGSGSFRFSTNPNLLEITADTFFVGSSTQFISGSGGHIEISSSLIFI